MKKECIRQEWPRVTAKNTRTATGWKIDARRTGTNLKEEWRADRAEALKRAAEIAADYNKHGQDGLREAFMGVAYSTAPHLRLCSASTYHNSGIPHTQTVYTYSTTIEAYKWLLHCLTSLYQGFYRCIKV